MKVEEKYQNIFGKIESLAESVSWATGISNMLEWLIWETQYVLGVTKTDYRKMIVRWSHEEALRGATFEETLGTVVAKYNSAIRNSEMLHRYDPPTYTLANPREALRRAKYFSENYLNKEFDIFWGLVSDKYLDEFYGKFTNIRGPGTSIRPIRWFTHGNSGLFVNSTGIVQMQMDNVSYNPEEGLLVANELKLGGQKNPDQLLKYGLLFRKLIEKGFVPSTTRFLLLFIGPKEEEPNWSNEIEAEIEFCTKSLKSTAEEARHPHSIRIAKECEYASTTWYKLIGFNEGYMSNLTLPLQQAEEKLIRGFNETLSTKFKLQAK